MNAEQQDIVGLFGRTLTEIADAPHGLVRDHASLTELLLRRLHEKGLTLAQCADHRVMNRSTATLQGYARDFELAFPDYVPLALRPRVEFSRFGDFYEVISGPAGDVAAKLNIVVMRRRDGEPMCGIPAHSFGAAKENLRPFFVVKVVKAKRRAGKAVKHA